MFLYFSSFLFFHYAYITPFVVVPQYFFVFHSVSVFVLFAFQFLQFILIYAQARTSLLQSCLTLPVSPLKHYSLRLQCFFLGGGGVWGQEGNASQVVLVVNNPPDNAGDRRCRFDPWVGKIPWRWAWQPTQVVLPGESHGQRS